MGGGNAPDAVHVAMGAVSDRIDELPTGRTIVCVCRVGGRSPRLPPPWPERAMTCATSMAACWPGRKPAWRW